VRPDCTEQYCKQQAAKARPGVPAAAFATRADAAARMTRRVRVPRGGRVPASGEAAFEARQTRAACKQRGFDWITPANPERMPPGQRERKRPKGRGKDLDAETLNRMELCPGLTGRRRGGWTPTMSEPPGSLLGE
jgi:hypothetical protein